MKRINQLLLLAIVFLVVLIGVKSWMSRHAENKGIKVLSIHTTTKIKGMDPVAAIDRYTSQQITKVYEPLLTYSYTQSDLTLAPLLAQDLPEVSKDSLTYTFKLKKGVKFQDDPCFENGKGREVVAQDWVFSFKRVADPTLNCPWYEFFTPIKGFREFTQEALKGDLTDYTHPIAGMEAVDKYTLRITLTRPCAQFLSMLTMSFASVVPKEAVQRYAGEFINHAVGTGPFCLKQYSPMGLKIVFEKNPTYRDEYFPTNISPEFKHMAPYAGKKIPFVDRVEVNVIPETSTAWLKFKQGKLDMNEYPSPDVLAGAITTEGELKKSLADQGIQMSVLEGATAKFIYFNLRHPLLKENKWLRIAMSLAFDVDRAVKLVLDGNGIVAHSAIPAGLQGYNPNYKNPNAAYNVEKAKTF